MTTIKVQVPEDKKPEDVVQFFKRGYNGYRNEWAYADKDCPKKYKVTIKVEEV